MKNLTDKELMERYLGIKVALSEIGHTENLIKAYISCTEEISMRYFDEHGLIDIKSREELVKSINAN